SFRNPRMRKSSSSAAAKTAYRSSLAMWIPRRRPPGPRRRAGPTPPKFSIAATVHRHETATNQRGGLVSGGDGIADAKAQTSAWTCGRNCSGRGSPTDLGAAAQARAAPRRAFEREVVVLRGVGNAEVEADDIEERHGRQSNALRAIKAGDLKNRDVAAGREGLR